MHPRWGECDDCVFEDDGVPTTWTTQCCRCGSLPVVNCSAPEHNCDKTMCETCFKDWKNGASTRARARDGASKSSADIDLDDEDLEKELANSEKEDCVFSIASFADADDICCRCEEPAAVSCNADHDCSKALCRDCFEDWWSGNRLTLLFVDQGRRDVQVRSGLRGS